MVKADVFETIERNRELLTELAFRGMEIIDIETAFVTRYGDEDLVVSTRGGVMLSCVD